MGVMWHQLAGVTWRISYGFRRPTSLDEGRGGRRGFRSQIGWPGARIGSVGVSEGGNSLPGGPTQAKPAVPGCQRVKRGKRGGNTYLWGPLMLLLTKLGA